MDCDGRPGVGVLGTLPSAGRSGRVGGTIAWEPATAWNVSGGSLSAAISWRAEAPRCICGRPLPCVLLSGDSGCCHIVAVWRNYHYYMAMVRGECYAGVFLVRPIYIWPQVAVSLLISGFVRSRHTLVAL